MRTFVLVMLVVSVAHADKTAKQLFDEGTAAYALGRYDQAADAYEKAFTLKQDPALLYNAAQAHRKAGNKKHALTLYENYLRLYGNRIPNREEVNKLVLTLRQAIASEQHAATAPPSGVGGYYGPEPAAPAVAPVAVVAPPPPPIKEAPPKKKLWIVGVVVGAAVAVGLGVGLGVGLSSREQDPTASLGTLRAN